MQARTWGFLPRNSKCSCKLAIHLCTYYLDILTCFKTVFTLFLFCLSHSLPSHLHPWFGFMCIAIPSLPPSLFSPSLLFYLQPSTSHFTHYQLPLFLGRAREISSLLLRGTFLFLPTFSPLTKRVEVSTTSSVAGRSVYMACVQCTRTDKRRITEKMAPWPTVFLEAC